MKTVKIYMVRKPSDMKPEVMSYIKVYSERLGHNGLTAEYYAHSALFITELENEYNIDLPEDITRSWKTFEDIVETVCKLYAIKEHCTHLSRYLI